MTAWLLTWVVQGVALVAAVAIMLRLLPRLNAATRYAIWFGALIAIAWPWWMSASPVDDQAVYVPSAPDRALSTFVGVWVAIALINLIRIVPSLHAVYRLRDRCRAFPPDLEARLPLWLEVRNTGRRTHLKICDAVRGATVLGFHGSCIALPPALVGALTPAELDQIILHEYAHVQRRDDWSRLVEALALAALWIHPAAHIISRALHRQREMACDEWVVARTGQPKAYATCLVHAAEVRGHMRGTPALLSAFLGRGHELVARVDRLLTMSRMPRRRASLTACAAASAALVILLMPLQSIRFAEIAEFVLPQVGAAPMVWAAPGTVRLSAAARPNPASFGETRRSLGEGGKADPTELSTATRSDAPGAPGMSTLEARSFEPLYASTSAPIAAAIAPVAPNAPLAPDAPGAPNRWTAPGVEIASAAKKTSVGVANMFSRAGVSLARSF